MTPAAGTFPELLRRPFLARRGIAQRHLLAAALASDPEANVGIGHSEDSIARRRHSKKWRRNGDIHNYRERGEIGTSTIPRDRVA